MIHFNPKLDELPVLVLGGSVIPRQPLVQNTDLTPQGPLELRVYTAAKLQGSLYADDGNTFAYKRGEFFRAAINGAASDQSLTLKIGPSEGKYTPWWKSYAVVVFGAKNAPTSVTVGGQRVSSVKYDQQQKSAAFEVPFVQTGTEVVVQY